jgi:hypothetical protein
MRGSEDSARDAHRGPKTCLRKSQTTGFAEAWHPTPKIWPNNYRILLDFRGRDAIILSLLVGQPILGMYDVAEIGLAHLNEQ